MSDLSSIAGTIGSSVGTGSQESVQNLTNLFDDLQAKIQSVSKAGEPVGTAVLQSIQKAIS